MRLKVAVTSPFLVFFFVALHVVAIFLFLNGFFLTRYEIPTRSQCTGHRSGQFFPTHSAHDEKADDGKSGSHTHSHERSCWMPRRFRRVLFVIVDALRFDFTLYTHPAKSRGMVDGGGEAEEDYYVNNMPFINDLLHNNASNTFLFRFVADAPTTTLQRLKALNTGGIPTFLEAKNNFDSTELSEDNLIAQMRDNGRGVVFMGDDTWAKLFPPNKRYFARCHPFPSFNVKDLHTVDDGVMRHLFPEMRDESTPPGEDGWEVIVAHFLGVDHAGHRFGPSHPQMRQKLRQMNGILQQIVEAMEEDTVLFVMGDHGMTADGNHGGHTESEVTAALFVYSPSPHFNKWDGLRLEESIKDVFARSELDERLKVALHEKKASSTAGSADEEDGERQRQAEVILTKDHFRQVSQIDVVPTIALLMGLPIPFGNLGGIIPELFLGIAPPAYYSFDRDDVERLLKRRLPTDDAGGDDDVALDEDGLFFEYLERNWGARSHLYAGDRRPSLAGLRQWLDGFERLNAAMEVNSRQIDAYLSAYAHVSPSFPSSEIDGLRRHFVRANDLLHSVMSTSTFQGSSDTNNTANETEEGWVVERVRQHYRAFKHYHRFQKQVADVCRRLWATFDVSSMAWGLVLLLASIGGLVFVVFTAPHPSASSTVDFSFVFPGSALGLAAALAYSALSSPRPSLLSSAFHDIPALVGLTLTCSVIGFVSAPLLSSRTWSSSSSLSSSLSPSLSSLCRQSTTLLSVPLLGLFALHGIGLFSNSFIEAEQQTISFLLTSALLCYLADAFLRANRRQRRALEGIKPTLAAFVEGYQDALKLVVLLFIIRFCPSIAGRHESVDTTLDGAAEDAFPPPIIEPTEASQVRAASPESEDLVKQCVLFFFSAQFAGDTLVPLSLVLFTFAYALRNFFSFAGPASPPSPSPSALLPACALFGLHAVSLLSSAVYWAFQRLALLDRLAYLWKILLPRIVYSASVLSLLLLLMFLFQRRRAPSEPNLMARPLQGTFMVLGMVVCTPVMLVFGPNSCWTFVSFLCGPLLFLDVNARMKATTRHHHDDDDNDGNNTTTNTKDTGAVVKLDDGAAPRRRRRRKAKEGPGEGDEMVVDIGPDEEEKNEALTFGGAPAVIVWAFFAILFFYKSGHLCDFSSLQFEAPFIGFEEMNMIAGGVLMVLNTFGCYFLFVPFLPLLLFYRSSSSSSSWPSSKRSKDGGERRYTREEVRGWTLRVVWTFMLAFVVKLFLTTLFVFLVRRHLMVWKVFAPKYIFDASATALIDLLLVLLYLFAYTFL